MFLKNVSGRTECPMCILVQLGLIGEAHFLFYLWLGWLSHQSIRPRFQSHILCKDPMYVPMPGESEIGSLPNGYAFFGFMTPSWSALLPPA
jgi:hypothetical protein